MKLNALISLEMRQHLLLMSALTFEAHAKQRLASNPHTQNRNRFTPHCGARERARNPRRIGAGQIRAENGLAHI